MNTTLLSFVILYLLGTMAIGMYAGKRIKNTSDFALAGRSLPVFLVITTTFATWFGAETVMGAPAKFIQGGLNAVIEEPIGAGLCLVLVGAFGRRLLGQLDADASSRADRGHLVSLRHRLRHVGKGRYPQA